MARLSRAAGGAARRHFSGLATRLLIDYATTRLGPERVETVLREAGEARSVEQLLDGSTWSSYDQFRRLLETTASALGGLGELEKIGAQSVTPSESAAETEEALHALGSPDAVYASSPETNRLLWTVATCEMEQIGPREWIGRIRLLDGFEPFRELCTFQRGLQALAPTMFGLTPAQVTEESCQCDGSPCCQIRIRWNARDDEATRSGYADRRVQVLERRLQALQHTVSELVSGAGLDDVLSRIVASAARAVAAPSYVLVIDVLSGAPRRVFAEGIDDPDESAALAEEILAGTGEDRPGFLVVDVASQHRRYGRLAAVSPGGDRFLDSERHMLEVYASLAAAALDSAAALDDSRQQAATAHALLELSASLALLASSDEMAARVARAVPRVVDCDQVAVVLIDPATEAARNAAAYGFPPAVEAYLLEARFLAPLSQPGEWSLICHDRTSAAHDAGLADYLKRTQAEAIASFPIAANAELIGWIVVGVTHDPDRLRRSTHLEERLRGLAGQTANAICNARLLDQVRHQALHDPMTGLPNRTLILDRAEHMLARARRERRHGAALFIDLDNFKNVNDTLGHAAGDELLQAVGARISGVLRGNDTVGRLGGDEFVVLIEAGALVASPELIAERVSDVLREPFFLDALRGAPLSITASVGIASGDRPSASELLRDADIALYRAKGAGKGRYAVFESSMQTEIFSRLELEMALRTSPTEQYFLVYQPILALADMSVTGFEALLRWQHPVRGVVGPAEFVPILEDTGMINSIGAWVLRQACSSCAAWRRAGSDLTISVNVSMRQLEADSLIADIEGALRHSGLDPESLLIEITETALMRDAWVAIERLNRVKDLGVRIAIDDFGTGYSSLAYLRQFPVDALKIDRSFIATMRESTEAAALTHALVKLGHTLGLETVAEGIERSDQLQSLRLNECDSGQGYLFSAPIQAVAVRPFLQTWSRRPAGRSGAAGASEGAGPSEAAG
jgi:diguanylate cyclase (GGDEF)-like protein